MNAPVKIETGLKDWEADEEVHVHQAGGVGIAEA